jgi:hypothetical protein
MGVLEQQILAGPKPASSRVEPFVEVHPTVHPTLLSIFQSQPNGYTLPRYSYLVLDDQL